ncbi:hypothetical protein IWQ57_004205, partial [Coemansia nantahalensis]
MLPVSADGDALPQWRSVLYENRTLASAVTAAVTGTLVGYPFDSLKTRMQTHHYPSLLVCARRSIAEEGIAGLYRGLLPPLLTASGAKAMSFSVFEKTKQWLQRHDPHAACDPPLGLPNFQRATVGSVALTAAVAGCASGALIATLCSPLELVKVQMQLARLVEARSASALAGPGGAGSAPPEASLAHGKRAPPPRWSASNLSVLREIVRRRGVLGMCYGLNLHI